LFEKYNVLANKRLLGLRYNSLREKSTRKVVSETLDYSVLKIKGFYLN
jgi:hypothetical protein